MPLSQDHKARTRSRILATAATLFRARGYEGVGIKTIMEEAGLTHGGFYAHFESKSELLQAVLQTPLEFTAQLEQAAERGAPMAAISYYIDPENFDKVAGGCTLATLLPEAARSAAGGAPPLADQIEALCQALAAAVAESEPDLDAEALRARAIELLQLCIANITIGRALGEHPLAREIAQATRQSVEGKNAR